MSMAIVCPCIASKAPAHLGWAGGRGEDTIPLGLTRFFTARLFESLVTFWTQTPVTHAACKTGLECSPESKTLSLKS